MPAGPQGKFGGGAKGSYDTATQSFRKPGKQPPQPGAKSGFANASSTTRPLTGEEHEAAAGVLAQGGLHRAAAHHRAASDQLQHAASASAPAGDDDGDEAPQAPAPSAKKAPKAPGKAPGGDKPMAHKFGK